MSSQWKDRLPIGPFHSSLLEFNLLSFFVQVFFFLVLFFETVTICQEIDWESEMERQWLFDCHFVKPK